MIPEIYVTIRKFINTRIILIFEATIAIENYKQLTTKHIKTLCYLEKTIYHLIILFILLNSLIIFAITNIIQFIQIFIIHIHSPMAHTHTGKSTIVI